MSWAVATEGIPEVGLSVTAALRVAQNASGWSWHSVCRSLAVVPCAARLLVRSVTERTRCERNASRSTAARVGQECPTYRLQSESLHYNSRGSRSERSLDESLAG